MGKVKKKNKRNIVIYENSEKALKNMNNVKISCVMCLALMTLSEEEIKSYVENISDIGNKYKLTSIYINESWYEDVEELSKKLNTSMSRVINAMILGFYDKIKSLKSSE